MQLRNLLVSALAFAAAGIDDVILHPEPAAPPKLMQVVKKTQLDINQKVYIENSPVLGDGAGEGALNNCQSFADAHVANPAAP
eukprot:CAMPEP_0203964068 /NCGR_PEP_ID=MMETSP0359-20131031/93900_1 /ASSEMBLY_ACC=CAM_ASM_000338 /TAXON_ID=268821 /ORGANISM="Scrippsiella Hangoei, Strain SHTV-5" /LENGTH=82 /DNA_ID=CAMNT_0050900285 /DNA_START=90 /DNA_END=334 /DNA_ORIENTATION=+